MHHLTMPLNDAEEAVLELLKQLHNLKEENRQLKEENKRLRWTLEEQD